MRKIMALEKGGQCCGCGDTTEGLTSSVQTNIADSPALPAGIVEWDPRAPSVLNNQYAAYDEMRRRCAVAYSDYLQYSVFRHADVLSILSDPTTFSSRVSNRVSVPNSMDPPEHGAYRRIVEGYFDAESMARFAPDCRKLSHELVQGLEPGGKAEIMASLAHPFALRAQCAFLGWSEDLYDPLHDWIRKKNAAVLSGDPAANAAVGLEFDETIRRQLEQHRRHGRSSTGSVIARLSAERVNGRALSDPEIVSILRNWTVGELATLAASVGIIIHYLASHPEVQDLLRRDPTLISAANDEILRIQAPLIANRRVTTKPVNVGGSQLPAGARLTLIWASANRDEAVFGNPDGFRLDRDPSLNLLYGAGIHACPGAPLARLELQMMVEAVLEQCRSLERVAGDPPSFAVYPQGGFDRVRVQIHRW